MFEHLFDRPWVQRQHAERVHAGLAEKYACMMRDVGYGKVIVRHQLRSWECFLEWVERKGCGLRAIDAGLVRCFMEEDARDRRWRGKPLPLSAVERFHRPSLGNLLKFLRTDGLIAREQREGSEAWHAQGLAEYGEYLRTHRAITEETISLRLKEAAVFLDSLPLCSWPQVVGQVQLRVVDAYIVRRAAEVGGGSIKSMVGSLRSFLRYLYVKGLLDRELASQVCTPRGYRLASLPKSVAWDDVQKTLKCVDRTRPIGRRDYAILLLLATYGWRACEVVRLTLDDIDWRQSVIRLRHGKNGRSSEFPLLAEVGEALIEYLRDGRPASTCREVFLRTHAPCVPFTKSSAIWHLTKEAFVRAGLTPPRFGPHTLRHSFAAHLLGHGASLKTIGDVLGHRDPESTNIYTKVDVTRLREVALDAGEGQS